MNTQALRAQLARIYSGARPATTDDLAQALTATRNQLATATTAHEAAVAAQSEEAVQALGELDGRRRAKLRQRIQECADDLADLQRAETALAQKLQESEARDAAQVESGRWKATQVLLDQRTEHFDVIQQLADKIAVEVVAIAGLETEIRTAAPRWPQYLVAGWGADIGQCVGTFLAGATNGIFSARSAFSPFELRALPDLATRARQIAAQVMKEQANG